MSILDADVDGFGAFFGSSFDVGRYRLSDSLVSHFCMVVKGIARDATHKK